MELNSYKLADITANLKVYNIIAFNLYLKEIWIDLISRTTKNENDKINKNKRQDLLGLSKLIFLKYYSLPGIIGDRLFRVFDSQKNEVLGFNEFKTGMNILFCEDYEKTLRFIFDFYDFDADGKISKEDIRVVLSYVTYSNETETEKKKLLNNNNLKYNDKINKVTKKLYESSVKNQNQLVELLEKCFNNDEELLDFISFVNIIENINSDIYFMIYIFLLEKRPFSFKSIQLYQNEENAKDLNNSEMKLNSSLFNFNDTLLSISLKKSQITTNLSINNHYKTISSTTAYSKSNTNEINTSIKEYKNKNKIIQKNKLEKKRNKYLFVDDFNINKTIFEAKLSKDIIYEMNKIKYINEEKEIEQENETNETDDIFESEKNNYECYIYKYINKKMIKIWFKLYYKDIFYYKDKGDKFHKGMHNISGLFFKEEPIKIFDNKTFYSFSILLPFKTRTYFSDNEEEYNNWVKYLKLASNYSNILELYNITDVLGSGSFSLVKLAENNATKEKVAVKIMEKKKMSSTRLESARMEIEIMKICQHPNIIHFIDSYENEDYIYIFMEYCEGGTFFNFLKKRNFRLREDLAVNIIHKMFMAVYYFHSYGITHRDLKPENILMTSEEDDADIKILDFGLGKIIGPNEKCSEPYGTIIYCAPEIILDLPYTKNVDSWSLGVITYITLYGSLPFWDKDRSNLSMKIAKLNPSYKTSPNNYISDEAKNFIQNLLIKDQYKRMSIKQALEHKWFQKYNKEFVKYRWMNKNKKNIFELYTSLNLMQNNKDDY
jgi:calcium/calmodulin-dependent protein kinase I